MRDVLMESRFTTLARRLVAIFHGLEILHPPEGKVMSEDDTRSMKRDLRVLSLQKTKDKLEKWFRLRGINVRIIYQSGWHMGDYAEDKDIAPIGKKGIITLVYSLPSEHPTTAWMLVHNLSHGLYDSIALHKESPYEQDLSGMTHIEWMDKHNLMGVDPNSPAIYPTTRSMLTKKIPDQDEAFHEMFTQWVAQGRVTLNPRNQELENELDVMFNNIIDRAEEIGAVVYNV